MNMASTLIYRKQWDNDYTAGTYKLFHYGIETLEANFLVRASYV